jgi:hypothetical protein
VKDAIDDKILRLGAAQTYHCARTTPGVQKVGKRPRPGMIRMT